MGVVELVLFHKKTRVSPPCRVGTNKSAMASPPGCTIQQAQEGEKSNNNKQQQKQLKEVRNIVRSYAKLWPTVFNH